MKPTSLRYLALFICISLLVSPMGIVRADVETSTEKQQFHVEFPDIDWCSLIPVWVVVDGDLTIHTTLNGQTTHVSTHTVWVTQVFEASTGELYTNDHGIEKYNFNLTSHAITETSHFIANGKYTDGQTWHLSLTTHYTMNADGTVTVELNHGNLKCP